MDTYQVTSMKQRRMMSNVLKGQSDQNVEKTVSKVRQTESHSPKHDICKCTCGCV